MLTTTASLAVLASGGLDSAILIAEAVRSRSAVYPLYIRCGLHWEADEFAHLTRFLAAIRCPALKPLHILEMPIADVYGDHWSITGRDVPGAETPDDAVFLPGRNVLLLSKALIWCHLHDVPELALAPLGSNPFPDATSEFFDSFAALVSTAVGGNIAVIRPYAELHKADVLRRGRGMPLGETFSCIHPVNGLHCGRCNKCFERQEGFREAGMDDPTRYAE